MCSHRRRYAGANGMAGGGGVAGRIDGPYRWPRGSLINRAGSRGGKDVGEVLHA